MVTFEQIQTAYYMVAATGVLIAAAYYVMNIRTTQRNMKEAARNSKIAYTMNIMQQLHTKEMNQRYIDLIHLDFKDFEDFHKKYDSQVNPESFAERVSYWQLLNMLGYQYKEGLIDLDTLYEISFTQVFMMWMKFGSIIREYRKSEFGKTTFMNFENLAFALWGLHVKYDPDVLKRSVGGYSPGQVERAFSLSPQ